MPWGEALRDLFAPARHLAPAEAAAVDQARRAHNLDRAGVIVPLLVVFEVLALVVFRPRGTGSELTWRWAVEAIHAVMATGVGVVGAVGLLARRRWVRDRVGELLTGVYVLGGAALVVASDILEFTLAAYLVAVAITVVMFRTRLAFTAAIHGGAFALVVAAIVASSMPALAQQRHLINAVATGLFGFMLSRSLYRSVVREEIQRVALERLNGELERRVAEQVGEITARAREVEELNRRLREKVDDRSRELALALERLAEAELGEKVLAHGTVLGDRYEIEHPIGLGGMGVVYSARDLARGERVAVKLIRGADTVDMLQRFLTEARAAAAIDHPAVVRILAVDVSGDGHLYQVLELLSGRTLHARIVEVERLGVPATVRVGEQAAAALAAAHRAGVIHRDVKPANIMLVDVEPGVKVLDFGLAKLRRQPSSVRTEGGIVLGTPEFVAPEQISTPDQITGAADVYALGGTLYRCLAGQLPFPALGAMQLLHAHVYDAPRPLAELAADAPPALCALIMRCLAKRPEDRPAAADLAAQLGALARELDLPSWMELDESRLAISTRPLRRDQGGAALAGHDAPAA